MGWFTKEEPLPEVDLYCDDEQLAALLVDLHEAWDYGLSQIGLMYQGLPVQVKYNKELKLFRVHLPSDYVHALNNYIPAASIGERYGH